MLDCRTSQIPIQFTYEKNRLETTGKKEIKVEHSEFFFAHDICGRKENFNCAQVSFCGQGNQAYLRKLTRKDRKK